MSDRGHKVANLCVVCKKSVTHADSLDIGEHGTGRPILVHRKKCLGSFRRNSKKSAKNVSQSGVEASPVELLRSLIEKARQDGSLMKLEEESRDCDRLFSVIKDSAPIGLTSAELSRRFGSKKDRIQRLLSKIEAERDPKGRWHVRRATSIETVEEGHFLDQRQLVAGDELEILLGNGEWMQCWYLPPQNTRSPRVGLLLGPDTENKNREPEYR